MILPVMNPPISISAPQLLLSLCASRLCALLCPLHADKKAAAAGEAHGRPARHASAHHLALHLALDPARKRSTSVQIGREMVVAEKSGPWMRVYANTDIEESTARRTTPMVGDDEATPPISGWMEAKGVVEETTPNGDQILMGAAANQEALASDPRGPANAAQSARLLYRRLVEMFPNSPLVPEAAWRAADIQWQIAKGRRTPPCPRPTSETPIMREQMDEDALKQGHQVLSAHALGGSGGLRTHRQQALRRLAGLAQVPGEGVRDLRSNTPPNIPTARARRRRFIRPSTAWPCSPTCMPPTATTAKAATPTTRRAPWPPQFKAQFADSDYCLARRRARVQIG